MDRRRDFMILNLEVGSSSRGLSFPTSTPYCLYLRGSRKLEGSYRRGGGKEGRRVSKVLGPPFPSQLAKSR